jgi:hypothetical protein
MVIALGSMVMSMVLSIPHSHAQTNTASNTNTVTEAATNTTAQNTSTQNSTDSTASAQATASENPTDRHTPGSTEPSNMSTELGQIKADFIRQLPSSQIQQGNTPTHAVLWLDQPAMTPFQKGNVILLPDQSQHAASPRLINFLRNQMPDFGWHTRALQVTALPASANDHLAVSLPPSAAAETASASMVAGDSTASSNSETSRVDTNSPANAAEPGAAAPGINETTPATANTTADTSSGPELLEYQHQLAEQLSYIVAQQRSTGATIIIAEGSSAAIVNHLIKNNKLQNIGAVILISAYIAAPKLNADAALAMAQHSVPVLDISFSSDNRFILQQQHYRAQLVRKYIKELYRQRQIAGWPQHEMEQQWVWKEIYGWLSHIGY